MQKPDFNTGIQLGLTPLFQFNFGFENLELRSLEMDTISNTWIVTDSMRNTESHWGFTAGYRNVQFLKFLNQMSSSREFSTDRRNFEVLYSLGVMNYDRWDQQFKKYTHQISGVERWFAFPGINPRFTMELHPSDKNRSDPAGSYLLEASDFNPRRWRVIERWFAEFDFSKIFPK